MLTFSGFFSVAANTDRRTPVRNTLFFLDETWISITDIEYDDCGTKKRLTYPTKGVDVSSLMAACQSPFIAFSIGRNVLLVAQTQLFYGLLDHLKATIISH
jgi:hypothetical protein